MAAPPLATYGSQQVVTFLVVVFAAISYRPALIRWLTMHHYWARLPLLFGWHLVTGTWHPYHRRLTAPHRQPLSIRLLYTGVYLITGYSQFAGITKK